MTGRPRTTAVVSTALIVTPRTIMMIATRRYRLPIGSEMSCAIQNVNVYCQFNLFIEDDQNLNLIENTRS